jgi:hypothetical protein
MARSDWAALLTEPAAEYVACSELQRFGLAPYMPQMKKRHRTRSGAFIMRHYPLFPRYLLLPIAEAADPAIHMARGVCRFRPVLADSDGHPWRAPGKVIEAVRKAEDAGMFDQILHRGDTVTLSYGVLSTVRAVLSDDAPHGMVGLLLPLFGGAKATVRQDKVVHAI